MKKLAFLSVLAVLGILGNAWAACSLQNDCSGANEYLTIPGITGCYECDKENCLNGTVISATRATLEGTTYTNAMFTCHLENDGDLWRHSDVTECTQSRYIRLKNDENARRIMINPNSGSPVIENSGGAIAVIGVEACMGYECDTGFTEVNGRCAQPNDNCPFLDDTKAVLGYKINNTICNPVNASTGLSNDAHVKSGDVCNIECVENGWNVKLNDDACEDGYEPASDKKKCVESAASRQQRQRRQENASKQEKCEESGGTWASNKCTCDSSKNLRLEAGKCKCLDDANYKRSADGKSCDITDAEALRRKCEAATGAYFENGKCKCEDRDSTWRNDRCVENTDIKRCKSATGTKWDYKDKECKCKDANYEYDEDNNECVESDAARKAREEAAEKARKQAELDAAKVRITSITSKLNSLKSGLSTSVWKNKEGNFNTSRLASDSVAAVVLGTAGGLITSNVIKKNQIKGGFEDISCTIRGQVVAGYGDEFQVGIQ